MKKNEKETIDPIYYNTSRACHKNTDAFVEDTIFKIIVNNVGHNHRVIFALIKNIDHEEQ